LRPLAALLALALARATLAEEPLPPPPRDPWTAPPPSRRPAEAAPHRPVRDDTPLGPQVAPAGFQAAAVRAEAGASPWRGAVATGLAVKLGGIRITNEHPNPRLLLYFGGQADGAWGDGFRRAARLRARIFTGGEEHLYLPSDGDLEAVFMLGPDELRFVMLRGEVTRAPGLGLDALVQAGTLPAFDGTLSLAGDVMRLSYLVAPVEAVWVQYSGGAHLGRTAPAPTESNRFSAATAARVRWSAFLPPMFVASLQADLVKLWNQPDLLASGEGTLGVETLRRTALFDVGVRWNHFTRRGRLPNSSERESEVLLLVLASLAL
jgi:hypothetical protein